ncbi:hypothetical protein [Kribbella sp. NPDC000426]|uniref:hypothetical protein n=1 Tax=Kribbella sp. NPDC000426 TaxID=3154255 RepID=UPI00332369A5
MVRPARVGIVLDGPSLTDLASAVRAASSAWGGMYYPIIDLARQDDWRRTMEALAVDFLWPIMETPAAEEIARQVGWTWRGAKQFGAFAPPEADSSILHRVLRADEWIPTLAPDSLIAPNWADDDPLAALFSTWLGRIDDSDILSSERYLPTARQVSFASSEPLPSFTGSVTPIRLTASQIDYQGETVGSGVLVIDPGNVQNLIRFWNIRAAGGGVIPWPRGHDGFAEPLVRQWLESLYPAAAERTRERYINLEVIDSESDESPELLRSLLNEFGIDSTTASFAYPHGWYNRHPLMTEYVVDFSSTASNEDWSITASTPSLPFARKWDGWPGVIAAEVGIYRDETGPDRAAYAPRLRRISDFIVNADNMSPFQRATGEGAVYGLQASTKSVNVALLHPLDIFSTMFNKDDATFDQSDDGRFSTRLAETLGATITTAATQPAVRAVLMETSEHSEAGISFPHLLQIAERERGMWPDIFQRTTPKDYARQVVMWLLDRNLLRPVLPVKCPKCRNESLLDPDSISHTLICEFCSWRFTLGVTLGREGRRADWRYRLSGHVAKSKLKAALPVLATNAVLSAIKRSNPSLTKLDGLLIKSKDLEAEFDVAAIVDSTNPTVVLGEVKNSNKINAQDIANLTAAQAMLRSVNIDCYILVATLKQQLASEEISLLRELCERAPQVLHSDGLILPAVPIVWTGSDLSVPWSSEQHPWRGEDHWQGASSIALNSCKKNLALDAWGMAGGGPSDPRFAFAWQTD